MKRLMAAACAAAGLLTTGATFADEAANREQRLQERQQSQLFRAWFPDLATGRKAAISLHNELVESAWREGHLVFELRADQVGMLHRFGFRVEPAPDIDARRSRLHEALDAARGGIQSIPGYSCYETVEETFAAAQAIASARPQLAQWLDIGDSWAKTRGLGGHDLKVLKLGNRAVAGDKPRLFIQAAIHAREYTTAPLVLSFARWLADGHGVDPDATWILDQHEVHLLLQANPDGRQRAEAGLSWRKNTNTAYCSGNLVGADLNRNFGFHWNSTGGQGSSGHACDLTYRGPSPASEPETQAIEAYIRGLWPDRRGPGPNDAAPADTSGIHLDMHSYSQLVLWPWGTTASAAPNGDALQTLGRRFAYFNGYTPTQSIGLYPTDGTSDGPSYGELGVAAFTFELGTSFFQSCFSYQNTIQPDNLKALIYAAKVVRTPYLTPGGPEVLDLNLPAAPLAAGVPAALTATVSDSRFNQGNGHEPVQAIVGADAYIGTPPWAPGAVAWPLAAADGGFDTATEAVGADLPTAGLAPGRHLVYIVGRDASGASGPVSAAFLHIADAGGITLGLSKHALGAWRTLVSLDWDGARGRLVDVYRDHKLLRSTRNDGRLFDRVRPGTWTYRVCERGPGLCSAEQSITTP